MRVYKIEYREYEYQCGISADTAPSTWGSVRSDWLLTHPKQKHVMADNTIDAVDLLRADVRHRIEVASMEHICKVDIKK